VSRGRGSGGSCLFSLYFGSRLDGDSLVSLGEVTAHPSFLHSGAFGGLRIKIVFVLSLFPSYSFAFTYVPVDNETKQQQPHIE